MVTRCQERVPPQLPLVQVTPVGHCGLPPHWQPLTEQLSARVRSQAAHAAPPEPHELSVPAVTQPLVPQQPEQLVESQTHALLRQSRPAPHAGPVPQRQEPLPQLFAVVRLHEKHCAPLVPHSVAVGALTQVCASQQPLEQVLESQTHAPPTQ